MDEQELAREAVKQARRDEMAGPRQRCQCNAAREGVTHVASATLPKGTHQLWVNGELMTVTNDLAR